jgi:hypothetical protein
MQIKPKVGPVGFQSNNTEQDGLRSTPLGALMVGSMHAPFYEAVSRGRVYCACNQASITFGTGLTATGVTFHLSNPASSPVNLSILHCGVTFITSTTAGSLVYAANVVPTAADVVHGTPGVVRNAKLGGAAGYGLFDVAATLPAAPVAIRTLASGFTTNANISVHDYVNGAIVVAPGCTLSIQGITIVGTGLIDMCWEECALS